MKQSLVQDREVTLSRKASCVKIGDISNTLSCQRYSHSRPNHQIQVYKIKHPDMQTAATNICERTGCSQELRGLQRATVIGRRLCNKSSHEISLLLNITQSSSGGIITKWKWRQMSENFWWYSLSVQKFRDSQIIQRESLRQFENVRLCGLKNTLQCLCLWFWLFIYQLCVLSDQCREYTGTFFLVYAVSRKADLFKLVQHLILYNLGIKFLYWYIIEIEKWHNNRVTLSAKLQQG